MRRFDDTQIDIFIGGLLRTGVFVSCFVTLIGLGIYLFSNAASVPQYHIFHSVNVQLRSLYQLVPSAFHRDPAAIIQLGVLLLIATPVARVAFLVGAFALQKDRLYVAVSALVLVILLFSILFGA